MSNDLIDAILLEREGIPGMTRSQAVVFTKFHKKGLSIPSAAAFYQGLAAKFYQSSDDPEPIERLVLLLRIGGTLIATGRRGSDDQLRTIIEPAAWYRLNIIGDGEEGVAQDRYGS